MSKSLADKAIAALARHEAARQAVDGLSVRIGVVLGRCPETIAAISSDWAGESETPHFDGRGRVKNHLWRAYNDTTECESGYGMRRLDSDEQEEGLRPRNGGCRHCLRAWRLIRDRSIARRELGIAKRVIRHLGKVAMLAGDGAPERQGFAKQATVWLAPTKGRRYLTRAAAINAEARALIYKKHPKEHDHDEFRSWVEDIQFDEPERYATMHRRLSRLIKSAIGIRND